MTKPKVVPDPFAASSPPTVRESMAEVHPANRLQVSVERRLAADAARAKAKRENAK
jgi:hypothetical protein